MGKDGERKRVKRKRRDYIGWRSVQLSSFLAAVGKDSDVPLPQSEVCDIVSKYIQDHRLVLPGKRNKVVCDPVLRALFRRKAVHRFRLSDLLAPHFTDNLEDELFGLWFSEDLFCKRKSKGFCAEAQNLAPFDGQGEAPDTPRKGFASVAVDNVKFVYLKRSLVVNFLDDPDTFEDRMVGSVVRVKSELQQSDPRKSLFRLYLVTGVERLSKTDEIGEGSACFVVLRASDAMNDIRITMLSDGDFDEEECDDLKQRVTQGLVRRLSVAELESKAQSLRKFIIDHWIDQELSLLQNQIDRANEKGHRRELYEYVERKELLETSEERSRLMAKPIRVEADPDIEFEDDACHDEYVHHNQGKQDNDITQDDECEDIERVMVSEETLVAFPENELVAAFNGKSDASPLFAGACEAAFEIDHGKNQEEEIGLLQAKEDVVMNIGETDGETADIHAHGNSIVVIEIDDDDENDDHDEDRHIWHYKDPNGDIQGPFPSKYLRVWKARGFFNANFKVWRGGQDVSEAIFLNDLFR